MMYKIDNLMGTQVLGLAIVIVSPLVVLASGIFEISIIPIAAIFAVILIFGFMCDTVAAIVEERKLDDDKNR